MREKVYRLLEAFLRSCNEVSVCRMNVDMIILYVSLHYIQHQLISYIFSSLIYYTY